MDKAAAFVEGDQLEPAVDALLRAEDWDALTGGDEEAMWVHSQVVMKRLEQQESLEEGALKPHKAKVKEVLDATIEKIQAERAAAEAAATPEGGDAAEEDEGEDGEAVRHAL